MAKLNTYELVTNRIIELLEAGTIPWRKPWSGKQGIPTSAATGKRYRGINLFLLHVMGYEQPNWITYNQAKKLGGQVRKGEHGSKVVFWKWLDITDKETGEPKQIPLLRHYTVFNVEQCDDLPARCITDLKIETFEHDAIAEAETILNDCPAFQVKQGSKACYTPGSDAITMPPVERFKTREEYYSTLFHELVHWTAKRVNRETGPIAERTKYAFEELVAEMGAAMLCGLCGIVDRTVDNSAAYVAGWLKALRDDKQLVIKAAAAAQKAVDYITNATFDDATKQPETVTA